METVDEMAEELIDAYYAGRLDLNDAGDVLRVLSTAGFNHNVINVFKDEALERAKDALYENCE